MPTAAGRPNSGSAALTAWVIPAGFAVCVVLSTALYLGAGAAALLETGAWQPPRFSPLLPVQVALSDSAAYWPSSRAGLVWGATAAFGIALLAPLGAVAAWLIRSAARRGGPLGSMARAGHVAALTPAAAERTARRLRPSLKAAKKVSPGDTGVVLGKLLPTGPRLYSSWEDVLLAVMAPRSGKTTSLAVPAVLSAPGAVVATSNKSDLWAATARLRAESTSEQIWTFDPQNIAREQQSWWWNPLCGLDTVEASERLANHFVTTVDDPTKKDIWGPAGQELLAALLLAAACRGGSLRDVYSWLNAESNSKPVEHLTAAGHAEVAASLSGMMKLPTETKGSVYFTARAAARCLRNPEIMAWVTPPEAAGTRTRHADLVEFDADAFATTRQTLYLLSKDGGGSAAPLVAALTDRVMRAAVLAAEARGGRLDPPMVVVLDEAANVCRIGDLPELYSHLGSRGVIPLTILQSYSQGTRVWGDAGMKTLWSAATVKIIGPGIDDASFAEDLSRLVGEHDVTQVSINTGEGRTSRTRSTRTQRILPAGEIRQIPKGQALVLATGTRPAMVKTLPYYEGEHASDIAQSIEEATARITFAAAGATS